MVEKTIQNTTRKAARRVTFISSKSIGLDLGKPYGLLRLKRLHLLQQSVYDLLDEVLDLAVEKKCS